MLDCKRDGRGPLQSFENAHWHRVQMGKGGGPPSLRGGCCPCHLPQNMKIWWWPNHYGGAVVEIKGRIIRCLSRASQIGCSVRLSSPCIINRPVHTNLFLELSKMQGRFMLHFDKQMLEKVFCSNIAPSLSSGNHLFYMAEYMGRSCPKQVWAITFTGVH